MLFRVSVLNREPMGMKPGKAHGEQFNDAVSVLNREPMGMKRIATLRETLAAQRFSAQPRADGDEAYMVMVVTA